MAYWYRYVGTASGANSGTKLVESSVLVYSRAEKSCRRNACVKKHMHGREALERRQVM